MVGWTLQQVQPKASGPPLLSPRVQSRGKQKRAPRGCPWCNPRISLRSGFCCGEGGADSQTARKGPRESGATRPLHGDEIRWPWTCFVDATCWLRRSRWYDGEALEPLRAGVMLVQKTVMGVTAARGPSVERHWRVAGKPRRHQWLDDRQRRLPCEALDACMVRERLQGKRQMRRRRRRRRRRTERWELERHRIGRRMAWHGMAWHWSHFKPAPAEPGRRAAQQS
ncbi:uncharacterized protein J3D65DRAFT_76356 [Phyllosticta citribraziliensis]|uniref:Uncharacterized protein n=1 Tax=Phyllosticta citribraziliensis TaxID=989973 RepID=A0ABR1LDE1_9PEZI